jgi:hypothetical protein
MTINIQPITFRFPVAGEQIATQVDIESGGDNLTSQAIFSVWYAQSDGVKIGNPESCVMNGQDYTNWTGDNAYAIKFVCAKKNIVIIQ